MMASVCVFCASSMGRFPAAEEAARRLGHELAHRGTALIYGGGRVGLMGVVADTVLAAGGQAIGVMTRALAEREIAHTGLSELHLVNDMHARKRAMSDLSDGFVALPGGPGTFEEMFEQWTWGQLGIHCKPCGFLEVGRFFQPFRQMIEEMQLRGYLSDAHAGMILFDSDPAGLLDRFEAYRPPAPKWRPAGLSRGEP